MTFVPLWLVIFVLSFLQSLSSGVHKKLREVKDALMQEGAIFFEKPKSEPKRRKKSRGLIEIEMTTQTTLIVDESLNTAFDDLPDEIILHVFEFLSPHDVSRMARVCSRFNDLAQDHFLWASIFRLYFKHS